MTLRQSGGRSHGGRPHWIEVELDDPNIGIEILPDEEIEWLAARLGSERLSQTP